MLEYMVYWAVMAIFACFATTHYFQSREIRENREEY